jgi:hypothetical protein
MLAVVLVFSPYSPAIKVVVEVEMALPVGSVLDVDDVR